MLKEMLATSIYRETYKRKMYCTTNVYYPTLEWRIQVMHVFSKKEKWKVFFGNFNVYLVL